MIEFHRVHPRNFTAVNCRGNYGGYSNLAVYRLIWFYRLPPECLPGNTFLPLTVRKLPGKLKIAKKNVTVCWNYRQSGLPPTKITAGLRYQHPKQITLFEARCRLSDPCLTRRSEADLLAIQAIRTGTTDFLLGLRSQYITLFFFFFLVFCLRGGGTSSLNFSSLAHLIGGLRLATCLSPKVDRTMFVRPNTQFMRRYCCEVETS